MKGVGNLFECIVNRQTAVLSLVTRNAPFCKISNSAQCDRSIGLKLTMYCYKWSQERPLMQSIKGRRLIVYACVICWTTRNKQILSWFFNVVNITKQNKNIIIPIHIITGPHILHFRHQSEPLGDFFGNIIFRKYGNGRVVTIVPAHDYK